MGVIEVLPTPAGRLLMDLFREGCQVGVSSRGWASLREANGCITVQNDFELITCVSPLFSTLTRLFSTTACTLTT
jgi:hypothetical protein